MQVVQAGAAAAAAASKETLAPPAAQPALDGLTCLARLHGNEHRVLGRGPQQQGGQGGQQQQGGIPPRLHTAQHAPRARLAARRATTAV